MKINDNSIIPKSEFSEIPKLTQRILNVTLGELEKEGVFIFPNNLSEGEDLIQNDMILKSVDSFNQSTNLMGFIGMGSEELTIKSRFSSGNDNYLLQYLLEKVLDMPNLLSLNSSSSEGKRLYNILVFLFPLYLKIAMRKGVFKTYVKNKYNDSNIKGVINVSEHIRNNTPFLGKVAYTKREYSYDNYLMQLLRHTVEYIKSKPFGSKVLSTVREEVLMITETTKDFSYNNRTKVIHQNKDNQVNHAYFQEYRPLQKLSLMILKQENQIFGSGHMKMHGLLFDGSWLWEEYINILVSSEFYHPNNKTRSGGQKLFSHNTGLIYPDFISHDDKNRIIVDAKYKPKENIGNKDYLQLVAYMYRFQSKTGFYVYPDDKSDNRKILKLNKGSTYEKNVVEQNDITVTKLGLVIPQNIDDYQIFCNAMKKSEETLQEAIFLKTDIFNDELEP